MDDDNMFKNIKFKKVSDPKERRFTTSETVLLVILSLTIGLLIGSFLNVCIYRIPRHENIAIERSHCTKCGNQIKWYDLIPVFSYIFLLGKCRKCKEKISIMYPTIELVNGLAYVGIYVGFGLSILTVIFSVLVSVAIVLLMIKVQNR